MGKQVMRTKGKAQVIFVVFCLIERLTRKSRVTKKAGSKNPNERTTWILQRFAWLDSVKEGKIGYKNCLQKKAEVEDEAEGQKGEKEKRCNERKGGIFEKDGVQERR
ncbi:hypothetical protein FCV25MIE_02839 [Fagus crenata]